MIKYLFVLFCALPVFILAQQINIEVSKNSLLGPIDNCQPKFIDSTSGNFVIRDDYEFTDPSKPATYTLPFKEYFSCYS